MPRYSTSSAFALTAKPSRIRLALYLLLALCLLLAFVIHGYGGHTGAALFSLMVSAYGLRQLWSDRSVGVTFGWRDGQWRLFSAGLVRPVELVDANMRLPWLTTIALRELPAGKQYKLALFADSASSEQLRRLRCRLTLER